MDGKKVEMTFRTGDLARTKSLSLTLADLHLNQKVDGRVRKVEDFGLFIEIEGSKVSGLCHKSEVQCVIGQSLQDSTNIVASCRITRLLT